MSSQSEDTEPLVKDVQEAEEAEKESALKPRCPFIIEPLMILYVVSGFPMMSIASQFLVIKVGESMGVDYTNLSAHGNGSDSCIIDKNDTSYLTREKVEAEAAVWNMYQTLVNFIPGLFSPLIFGSLADKIGRRMLFILPCVGSIVQAGLYMAIIKFDLPLYFILFACVEYFFGGMGALFTGAFAYISDTVPTSSRALRMTVIDVVSIGNAAIANLFVGYWIKAQGFFYPLVFVVSGKFLALLYAIFIIPETLKEDESRKKKLSIDDLVSAVKLCIYDNGAGRRWKINTLLLSYTVAEIVGTMSIMTLYEMNAPLCWNSVYIGYYSFVAMMVQSLAMLVMAVIPNRWISAEWKVIASRISNFAQNLFLGFVSTSLMMYIAPALGCISFLAIPMMRYMFSVIVDKNEQASVFSLMSVIMHTMFFCSVMMSNKIYEETLFIMHGGLVFFAAAGCGFVSLVIMIIYVYKTRKERAPLEVSKPGEKIGSIQA